MESAAAKVSVYLASDHAGWELKKMLGVFLREGGYAVEDMGASVFSPEDDYPDFIIPCAERVAAESGGDGGGDGARRDGARGGAESVRGGAEGVRGGAAHTDAGKLRGDFQNIRDNSDHPSVDTEHPRGSAARVFGIIIGGSGQGEAMAANRARGARAAVFYGGAHLRAAAPAAAAAPTASAPPSDPFDIVRLARQHNDANILSLGARFISDEDARRAVTIFLETPFSNAPRHTRRLAKY